MRVCLIVVRVSILKSLDDRWANLTIYGRPWSSRTIEWCYSTTILPRSWSISCYYLFFILLLLASIDIRNDIIYSYEQLIICFESLKLCLCRFSHTRWSLILCLLLILLHIFFLLCEPLRLFFLISLKCIAFAELFLFLSIAARGWVFPLLC